MQEKMVRPKAQKQVPEQANGAHEKNCKTFDLRQSNGQCLEKRTHPTYHFLMEQLFHRHLFPSVVFFIGILVFHVGSLLQQFDWSKF